LSGANERKLVGLCSVKRGQKRGVEDLEGEQSPWKNRLLIKLETAREQYGLVSGAKP